MAAMSEDMSAIFPGLVADRDARDLYQVWAIHENVERRCRLTAQAALGRAAGREWHWALNLIKEAHQSWTYINGKLVREGVRADETSLSDWLDAAFTLFTELYRQDKNAQKAFEMRLRQIPAGSGKARMSSRADLMAFAAD